MVGCDCPTDRQIIQYEMRLEMSDQSNLSEIESTISEFFEGKNFCITDNFPRGFSREKEIIMENKASALIQSILGTEKFINFMNVDCEPWGDGQAYKLKDPILVPISYHGNDYELIFDKIAFGIRKPKSYGRSIFLDVSISRCARSYTGYGVMLESAKYIPNDEYDNERRAYFKNCASILIDSANNELYKTSLFECCKNIGTCNTPQDVLLRFDCSPFAYGEFKLSSYKLGAFTNNEGDMPSELEKLINSHPNESEESTVQRFLYNFVIGNQPQFALNKFFEKNNGRFKHVYSFKDENGRVNQKVIKLFDFHKQKKLFIPCTSWEKAFEPRIICIPLPKGQILYNLDLLIKPDIKAVILTDSIEIADQNQKQQIVWTSFLSELALVDWKPLIKLSERGVPIYYLITNHSGRSLAEAYAEASRISSYLTNEQKLKLKFIQVAVNHNEEGRRIILNLSDTTTTKNTPEVVKRDGSVKIMLQEEFNKYYEKSQTRIPEFWEKQDQKPETPVAEYSKDIDGAHGAIDYILRPIIRKKTLIMIYAEPGFGKSKFTLSLCASIIAENKIFKHRWWTHKHVPKKKDEKKKEILNKILYIDYRYDEATQKKLIRDFVYPYFPDDALGKQHALDNLIIIDGKKLDADPQNISHHQRFLDLLEKAKAQGTKGHPVDLVVFDSFNGMVKDSEGANSWSNIMPLFDKIKETGAAVLLTHHSDANGDIQGFKLKKANCDVIINFTLPQGAPKASTLKEPRLLTLTKFTENSIPTDRKEFQIKFDFDDDSTSCDGKEKRERKECWQALDAEGVPTDEFAAKNEFLHLLEEYERKDYTLDAAANMLGMSRSQMFKLKKIYEEDVRQAGK